MGLADNHLKLTGKSEPGKKEGGFFFFVVQLLSPKSYIQAPKQEKGENERGTEKKEDVCESLNHPASLSHVETNAKASKYKLLL